MHLIVCNSGCTNETMYLPKGPWTIHLLRQRIFEPFLTHPPTTQKSVSNPVDLFGPIYYRHSSESTGK